jgi:hypothetical protein
MHFVHGQHVEVRAENEIRATLDAVGKLGGVPFMPEMARYCGRRFRVYRRADKTCVEGSGVRRMKTTVFLEEVRCDGSAHDGCQRNCLIFWKEAWLKPVAEEDELPDTGEPDPVLAAADGSPGPAAQYRTRHEGRYFCQSTELLAATEPLSRWNLMHFVSDIRHGELSVRGLVRIVSRMLMNRLRGLFGLRRLGVLAGPQKRNSKGDLNLSPGELVQIKSPEEIRATLDSAGKNAGLTFEPDMLEFCGGRYEIAFPIQKIIREETGQMASLSNTVALKGVVCQGTCAKNCPRSNPLYWREAWLRRVESNQQ